jgi:hypothetical protein
MTRTERTRLASFDPPKLGENDLRHVTEGKSERDCEAVK